MIPQLESSNTFSALEIHLSSNLKKQEDKFDVCLELKMKGTHK